jgi:hypothetical protein
MSLFVDGQRQGPPTAVTKHVASTLPFYIGADPNSEDQPEQFFAGIVDEARISTVGRYTTDFRPPARLELEAGTLALYHFDEGSGDTLTDSSGNGHHGKIFGAKWVPGIAVGPRIDSRGLVGADPQLLPTNPPTGISNPQSPADGNALEFNGKDSHVELPTLTYDGSYPLTIEATINPSQALTRGNLLVDQGSLALMFPGGVDANGRGRFQAFSGEHYGVFTVEDLTPGRTLHVAAILKGRDLRLRLSTDSPAFRDRRRSSVQRSTVWVFRDHR